MLTSLGMALTSGIRAKGSQLYKIFVSGIERLRSSLILMERLKFQMAWATKEEEAIEVVVQHMKVMDKDSKEDFCDLYTCLIFPR